METIQLIVSALAAGATTAIIEKSAGDAVKSAYSKLKQIITERYATVSSDVEQLESQPESHDLRKQIIEMGLKSTDAATDTDLHQQAKALLDAIQAQQQAEPNKVMGVNLEDIEAASMNLGDIIAQGDETTNTTIGVNIKGAKLTGDLNINNVTATNQPGSADVAQPPGSSQSSASPQPPQPQIKILFLAANPYGTTNLRLDKEHRDVDQALRQSEHRDSFDLEKQGALRINDLQAALLRHKPNIVHFSGHGEDESIILETADGKIARVGREALANLFDILKKDIRCVVLNACYSEAQAQAISQHIDVVIGMSSSILDKSAINFAAAFYQALGYGQSVQTAYKLGCNEIDLQNLGEAHKPQLLVRSGVDPDALILATGETDPKV